MIKVVCIGLSLSDGASNGLTVGKTYETGNSKFNKWYHVIDDYGYGRSYNSSEFTTIEKDRERKLEDLLK